MAGNKKQIDTELSSIRSMKQQHLSDADIMKQLGISQQTLYRYKAKLHERDKRMLEELIFDNFAWEIKALIDGLHKSIEICNKISEASSTPLEKLESERFKIMCHSELVKTLSQGPMLFSNIMSGPTVKKAIELTEEQLKRYTTKPTEPVNVEIKVTNPEEKEEEEKSK